MANPIDKYKAAQRRIRRCFDIYTARLCPECAEPCCRKPTRVREFDVLLANAHGCDLPPVEEAAGSVAQASIDILTGVMGEDQALEPCGYLGPGGCRFPDDLRPFECVKFICAPMKKAITPRDMREIRDLLHKLGVAQRELMESTMPGRRRH